MRTFYDFRGTDWREPEKFPLKGKVLLKTKTVWLVWIQRNPDPDTPHDEFTLHNYIIAPRSIYLYQTRMFTSFWEALKFFLKEYILPKFPKKKPYNIFRHP